MWTSDANFERGREEEGGKTHIKYSADNFECQRSISFKARVVEVHLKTSQHNQEIRDEAKESTDNEKSLQIPYRWFFISDLRFLHGPGTKEVGWSTNRQWQGGTEAPILLLLGRAKPQGVYPSPPWFMGKYNELCCSQLVHLNSIHFIFICAHITNQVCSQHYHFVYSFKNK